MRLAGFTLVEVLVATLLATLAIASALSLVARGRGTYRAAESQARLQETARAALDLIAAEARMAGYLGLAPPSTTVAGSTAVGIAAPAGLGVGGGCVVSLALDLAAPVAGADAAYAAASGVPLGCRPSPQGRAMPGADTLVLRRAASLRGPADAGRLQIEASRRAARLLADGRATTGPHAAIHDVEVSVFYVSADSTSAAGQPSLRRKRLIGGAAPAFQDEELVPGIEDLQVEAGVPGDSGPPWLAERFVPLDALDRPAAVRALRIWVLARSDLPEAAPIAQPELAYANRWVPAQVSRHRRLLDSRTVQLRNSGAP